MLSKEWVENHLGLNKGEKTTTGLRRLAIREGTDDVPSVSGSNPLPVTSSKVIVSEFLSKLEVRDDDDIANTGRGSWEIINDLIYDSKVAQQTFTVPKGFITDFASVPRFPLIYALFGDTCHPSAALHDYLYSTAIVSRSVADSVLNEASAVLGVWPWRRWSIWLAVRLFGSSHFKKSK